MRPILLSLGPIHISSLGFFLFLAFLVGTFVIWKKAKEKLYSEETVFDSIFLVTFSGLLGARLFYILFNWEDFGFNLLKWFLINGYAGLYFYGGLLTGIFTLYRYYKNKEISFFEMFDYFALAFWGAFILGELGVFLDGAEVGRETALPWAVSFVGLSGLRHPVSFYKALTLFLIFLVYWFILRKKISFAKLPGGVLALLFLLFFALQNFLLDFLKSFSVYYWGLGLDQWVSGGVVVIAGIVLYKHVGRSLRGDVTGLISKIKKQKSKF